MAVTEVVLSKSFLAEVSWARDTIIQIREYKMKDWPLGLQKTSLQPDELLAEFTLRDLALATYYRAPGLSIGSPEAYVQNIGTIVGYIERERQEEIKSANDKINEIASFKERDWSIGLAWPNAHPDGFSRYFAVRGLPIAHYVRGDVKVGEPSAYDKNIATLAAYIAAVGAATYR